MAKLGVTGGFSVVPICPFVENLAHILSAAVRPSDVSSAGVDWKIQNSIQIFLIEDIWEGQIHM